MKKRLKNYIIIATVERNGLKFNPNGAKFAVFTSKTQKNDGVSAFCPSFVAHFFQRKEVHAVLTGQYCHTIDSKGRVFVPAKFRGDLQGDLVIVKGLDDCIVLYNEEQWNAFIKKLETYGEIQMKKIKRFILASAFNTELDSQGRIVISQALRDHAKIEKEIAFVGLNNCVEIWRPDIFNEINDSSDTEEMKEMLKNVGF